MAMRRAVPRGAANRTIALPDHAPSAPRPRRVSVPRRTGSRPFQQEFQTAWTHAWTIPRWLYRGFNQSNAGDLAAAIAYHALIALVPSFLLLVSIAGFVFKHDEALYTALRAVFWALPNDAARNALESLIKAREYRGWIGSASIIGFAWAGTGFMTSLARGMNRVYGVPNRHYVYQRVRAFTVVVIFAILFQLAIIAATLPTYAIRQEFVSYFQPWLLTTDAGRVLSYGVAFVASFFLFFLLYLALPNAGQRVLDVLPGSLMATTLFLTTAQAFPIYLRLFKNSNQFSQIFGLGSLLIFWFYLIAHALLFGTYVNATWQCHRRRYSLPASCPRLLTAPPPSRESILGAPKRAILFLVRKTFRR